MRPSVSIIIPVFNVNPSYLRACLDAILAQTLRDWEAVCVDDGSTDGCGTILDEYAARDPRFRVTHRTNAGVAAARNWGLGEARGEYVAFMDADDGYPDADVLARLCADARRENVLICGGGVAGISEPWGAAFEPPRFVKAADCTCDYGFWRFLYHRSLFDDGTVRFPPLATYEDPVFLIRALAKAGGFYGVDYDTYFYRVGYKKRDFISNRYRLLKTYLKGLNLAMKEAARLKLTGIYNHLWEYVHGAELDDLAGHVHFRSLPVWFGFLRLWYRRPLRRKA